MSFRWFLALPWKTLVVLGLLVIVTGATYQWLPGFQAWVDQLLDILLSEDVGRFRQWIQGYGWWGPSILVLLMCLQLFMVVVPSFLLIIVSVLAYGALEGGLLALLASLVAAAFAYGFGTLLGQDWVEQVSGEKTTEKVTHYLDAYGFWTVIIVRTSPFLSNDVVSLVAGVLAMSFWRFLLATLIGIAPLILLVAWLGEDYDSMGWVLMAASLLGLLGLAVKIGLDHRNKLFSLLRPNK